MMTIDEALEGSTPLAEKARAAGPYRSSAELVARLRNIAPQLTEAEMIATLNAHPRMGENADRMSARSSREQGADVLPELERLNAEYERHFGFRFVVFVNRRSKAEILEVLRQRMRWSRNEELHEGLRAVIDIAEDRLREDR